MFKVIILQIFYCDYGNISQKYADYFRIVSVNLNDYVNHQRNNEKNIYYQYEII